MRIPFGGRTQVLVNCTIVELSWIPSQFRIDFVKKRGEEERTCSGPSGYFVENISKKNWHGRKILFCVVARLDCHICALILVAQVTLHHARCVCVFFLEKLVQNTNKDIKRKGRATFGQVYSLSSCACMFTNCQNQESKSHKRYKIKRDKIQEEIQVKCIFMCK